MRPLPPQYQPYAEKAELLLQRQAVRSIEFSGGTYQIELFDPELNESLWTFLQFDDKHRLADVFCTCDSEQGQEPCVHIAVAFRRIFLHSETPLHERFEQSLWNTLCFFLCDTFGDDLHLLTPDASHGYTLLHDKYSFPSCSKV